MKELKKYSLDSSRVRSENPESQNFRMSQDDGYYGPFSLPEIEIWPSGHGSSSDSDSWSDPWGSYPSDPWGGSDPGINPGTGGNTGGGNTGGGSTGGIYHPGNGGTSNPYPQTSKTISGTAILYQGIEGVGAHARFSYRCGVRISGYTMAISVSVNPYEFTDRQFWATVIVKKNGSSDETYYKLSYNEQGYINEPGFSVIGDTSFELPESGNVIVDVCIGYDYDTGAGNSNESTNVHIYPF